ncbi:MAG: cytochrome c oxidase subunit II [Caldilineaceae bacterium]
MPKSSTDKRHFIIAGVLVVIGTILMDLLLKSALPLPVQASIESLTIDQLIGWHLTLIAFLFSLVVVFMLYAIVVFRRREGDESDGDHFEGNTTLEIAWTVIPLILVVIFGYIGVVDLNEVTEKNEEITVKVTGFQWDWSFEYDGGVLSQELMLPVGKRARMEMTSNDVLHSFWVPEFRVKQDLVPGMTTDIYFTPREVGEYTLRCAELCGLSHYKMRRVVKVVEDDQFLAWLQIEQAKVNDSKAVADATIDRAAQ